MKEKDIPTTLKEIVDNCYLRGADSWHTSVYCDRKEVVDTAILTIKKWAEEKVPKKEHLKFGRNEAIDETLANIRKSE